MANTLAPFGFRHVASREGVTPSFGQTPKSILRTNTTPIYKGDPVVGLATGSATAPVGQQYIAQATPGTIQIAGIFVGCRYQSISMSRPIWVPYWPGTGDALADAEAYVITDERAVFKAQANAQLLPLHVGLNCNFVLGTGTPATGQSGALIDVSSIAATATLPFRILDLVTVPAGANGTDQTTPFSFALVGVNNVDNRVLTGI